MTIQTTFDTSRAIGVAGQLADDGPRDIVSGLYSPRKYVSIALTAVNSAHYILTITVTDKDGVAGTPVVYDYTADGSATTGEIAIGVAALVNAGSQAAYLTAVGTDTPLLIEADQDVDFSISYNANMVETVLVPSAANTAVTAPAGVLFVVDERASAASGHGAEDRCARLPRATGDVTGLPLGVSLETRSSESAAYRAQHMVPLLREGRILVLVEQTVLAGDPAFVRFASGAGGTQLGAFRKDADSASAVALPFARFATPAASGGLAVLEVRA